MLRRFGMQAFRRGLHPHAMCRRVERSGEVDVGATEPESRAP